jgi:uncharacterized membrane protein
MMNTNDVTARQVYWRENRRWMLILGTIWFIVSLGCGVLWVEPLNQIQFGGRHLYLYRIDLRLRARDGAS